MRALGFTVKKAEVRKMIADMCVPAGLCPRARDRAWPVSPAALPHLTAPQ